MSLQINQNITLDFSIPKIKNVRVVEGDKDSPDKDEFFYWINNVAIPELNKRFRNYETMKIRFESESGCFHCESDDRSSGGYLYIGAWTTEAMDKRND